MPEPVPTHLSPAAQGLVCVGAKLRLAERRQQRLREVQAKRQVLCEELAETQGRLMLEPGRWLEQCESRLTGWAAGRPSPRAQARGTPDAASCRGSLPALRPQPSRLTSTRTGPRKRAGAGGSPWPCGVPA